MTKPKPSPAEKKRSRRYSEQQLREFELAGGIEGGMPAGHAGGPAENGGATTPGPDKQKDE